MKIKELIEGLKEISVPVDKLRPNKWNFNEQDQYQMDALVESRRRFGSIYPVIVRQSGEWYDIIDGEHRWIAAIKRNEPTVRVKNLGEISDDLLKELMLILNEARGNPDQVRLAEVVGRLKEENPDLVLPYSEQYLEELKKIKVEPFNPNEYAVTDDVFAALRSQSQLCTDSGHDFKRVRTRRCKKCRMVEILPS